MIDRPWVRQQSHPEDNPRRLPSALGRTESSPPGCGAGVDGGCGDGIQRFDLPRITEGGTSGAAPGSWIQPTELSIQGYVIPALDSRSSCHPKRSLRTEQFSTTSSVCAAASYVHLPEGVGSNPGISVRRIAALHLVSITRFPLRRFSPGAGLRRNLFFIGSG